MAPSAAASRAETTVPVTSAKTEATLLKPWLKNSGVLDQYESFDVTPAIGREYPHADLVSWLQAPNSDELIKELALTISQRGVVFFRAQNNLTPDLQKELLQKIGVLSGKPATSGLHIHPLLNPQREEYKIDDLEISTIDSELAKRLYKDAGSVANWRTQKRQTSGTWHSDIGFENVPADYSSLRLVNIPKTGGDTLWASGYGIYDLISQPTQKYLEGLTATFKDPGFAKVAERGGYALYEKERGSPENVGTELVGKHPVIRTNPVTGWKSVFSISGHTTQINEVAPEESKMLLTWLERLILDNHDLHVRFKWQNSNDIAIWDNRSTFHTPTHDYQGQGERYGVRAVSIGERPYFDPDSKSRAEALAAEAAAEVVEPTV